MKLYMYSEELQTFVDATWTVSRYLIGGLLLGSVLLLGVMAWYLSAGDFIGQRSVVELTAENQVLRQHVSVMASQVSTLEAGSAHMFERAGEFRTLLHRQSIVVDTVADRVNVSPIFTFHVAIPEASGGLQ